MDRFPAKHNAQVSLANWRTPPFNVWAFHHVREIVPSAEIANDPEDVWELESRHTELAECRVPGTNGKELSWSDFLNQTHCDGLVILHEGRLIHEAYNNGLTRHTPHILMSVSKSVLGLLAGILDTMGTINIDGLVTDYVPELSDTAYEGSTLRNLLDMRAGIQFDEDYLADSGPLIEYRRATNWNPPEEGTTPTDLRSFYQLLKENDGQHGQRFHYVSPNTDLLAWIIERAAGRRYCDLVSEFLWKPMGAERSAYITVDRLGAPRAAGGMCATVRDLARLGQLLSQNGQRNGRQILPAGWISDLYSGGSSLAWAQGSFAAYYPGLPIHYRSQWYVLDGESPLLFGLGIHGQNVFVDRTNALVIANLSSQPLPLNPKLISLTMNAVKAVRQQLCKGPSARS
ncbi:MAG: beta-lactamase family protein [Fuerstiella sp.]|nr:beta-lactamase family protein [Fuerstiella sp.]